MVEFTTSDIAQATFLKFLGHEYKVKKLGRKTFFVFEPEANKDIEKFNDLRSKVYGDVFNN